MNTRIKVEMKPINTIVTRLGVGSTGDVQNQVTHIINHRMTQYMPYLTGVMSTKLKFVKSPTEIEVLGPYARFQYYGKLMLGIESHSAWAKKNEIKKETDVPLKYTKTNPLAGPKYDQRMMAAEGEQIRAEIQAYVDRGET